MTNPYRALCAELAKALHEHTCLYEGHESELVARARALLDQPVAGGATAKELRQIFDDQSGYIGDEQGMWSSDFVAAARAVLARWGNPTPQPPANGEVMP